MKPRFSFLSVRSGLLARLGQGACLWFAFNVAFAAGTALPLGQVELRDVPLTYSAEAVIEAVKQATVAAQVQGRVVDVRVDAGSAVKQGQVLMRIDERETADAAAGAEANAASAAANLANARVSYERAKSLFAQKFISQAALDQADAAYKAAQGQADAARAGHSQASTVKSFTTITSPLSGVVAQRLTEQGEMATPGKPLLLVFEPGGLRASADVPQYKVPDIRRYMKAQVELPGTGQWFEAGKVELLPMADALTHAVHSRVTLLKPEAVLPGMFARVHFVVGQAKKLVVPVKALLRRGEISAVYIADAQGRLSLRQLRVGENMPDGLVEVLAGAKAGERIVLDPVQAEIRLKQR